MTNIRCDLSSRCSDAWQANDVVCCSSIFVIWREFASKIDYRRYTQCQAVLGAPFSLIVYPRVRVPYDRPPAVRAKKRRPYRRIGWMEDDDCSRPGAVFLPIAYSETFYLLDLRSKSAVLTFPNNTYIRFCLSCGNIKYSYMTLTHMTALASPLSPYRQRPVPSGEDGTPQCYEDSLSVPSPSPLLCPPP